jgi:alcohol dehydrogenase (NADP+)
MPVVKAYAASSASAPLGPFQIPRREPGPNDVVIAIEYCGVCHSDVHQVRNEWGFSRYPIVPGHEIVGTVVRTGGAAARFRLGERVGVGCFVDSCRACEACRQHEEQFCGGCVLTYNGLEKDGQTLTYGGYSAQIVVNESYVLRVPANIPPDRAAPLLCAGITTYSPLKQWRVKAGDRIAVVGLGGLGHMGVKLASAMGAVVTVFSSSQRKREDAMRLGAQEFADSTDAGAFRTYQNHFDFILNTVSASIDLNAYLDLLKRDGTMVLVGAPEKPAPVAAFPLIMRRRRLAGSLIGGIKETQEMLDFCGQKGIGSDIELIPIDKINQAYDRMVKGDVRYRFVIDLKSLT